MSAWKTTLSVSPDLYCRLADIAKRRGKPVDEIVRDLLAERLALEPEPEPEPRPERPH